MKGLTKKQLWEYFVFVSRYWLALVLLSYGVVKLAGFQFYTAAGLLGTKVGDANLFQLSWFLADHEPFRFFVAISEIIAGLLLVFNRTAVIGAFLAIPIWLNILIWDISFMDRLMAIQFAFRIGYYLVLTGLVLWYYKASILIAYKILSEKINNDLKKSVFLYISLPIVGYALEFAIGKIVQVILTVLYRL